jgi:hypothetical protein
MSQPDLLKAAQSIAHDAVNAVAKRRGIAMRFKATRAFADASSSRVVIAPVRPVARLAAFHELFAEAEEGIQRLHAGLRVVLSPENTVRRQGARRASGAKAPARAAATPTPVRSRAGR